MSRQTNGEGKYGVYHPSYPGIAFTFPADSTWNPDKDYATMLALPQQSPQHPWQFSAATAGSKRRKCSTTRCSRIHASHPASQRKDVYPDEIGLVNIFGEGKLRLDRAWVLSPFWLFLGQTTPQELVAELGPPDAIYRKATSGWPSTRRAQERNPTNPPAPSNPPPPTTPPTPTPVHPHRTSVSEEDDSDSGSVDGK
ncbi:hypothetical protein ACLOAV_006490, partial [Pseudogymnoascus australis]